MCFHTEMCNLVVSCGRSRSIGVFVVLFLIILKKRNKSQYWSHFTDSALYIYTEYIKYMTKMHELTWQDESKMNVCIDMRLNTSLYMYERTSSEESGKVAFFMVL